MPPLSPLPLPSRGPICALVVSFNPDRDFEANIASLRREGAEVIVVDNASTGFAAGNLAAGRLAGVEIIENRTNFGIARALNQGVARARQRGFRWIATFDQDSHVTAGMFDAMWTAWESEPEKQRVALVAPRLRDSRFGTLHSFAPLTTRNAASASRVRLAATSGNLLPAHVFDAVGSYRDDFFIDYVDQEFCLRCRQRGWLLLEARDAVLDHRYGEPKRHRFGWMRPLVTNHAPVRRYYQMRNRLVAYRQFGAFDPRWVLGDAREWLRDTAKIACFEQDRGKKLAAMARGMLDGLRGRMGPAP